MKCQNFLLIVLGCCCLVASNVKSQEEHACANQLPSEASEPCFDKQRFSNAAPQKEAEREKSVVFECYVRNKGAYSVVWLHENQLIAFGDKVIKPDAQIQVETDADGTKFNLRIERVESRHKGAYRCQISTLKAKNLDYTLEILVAPSINRLPSEDVITMREGQSLTIQCAAHGNPEPEVTWTKNGRLVTELEESDKTTLSLESVDETFADEYSCMASNGVGEAATSNFQIVVKHKPKVRVLDSENVNNSVMYSANEKEEETITFIVSAFPAPEISLFFDDLQIASDSYGVEPNGENENELLVTYEFTGSASTFGVYKCLASNEMGSSEEFLTVTSLASQITLSSENLPAYSDAIVFEWSLLSGSPIREINVQVFHGSNDTNGTSLVTKTNEMPLATSSGEESDEMTSGSRVGAAASEKRRIRYRDFYIVSKLTPSTTYQVRMRVKNDGEEFGVWSDKIELATSGDRTKKIIKHKSMQQHHRQQQQHMNHNKMYGLPGTNLNLKRGERFNAKLLGESNEATRPWSSSLVCLIATLLCFYLHR